MSISDGMIAGKVGPSNVRTVKKMPQIDANYPLWAPRFWHGMRLGDWLSMLSRNRARVHLRRFGLATTVTCLTTYNSFMRHFQKVIYDKRVAATPLVQDPVFIIGHWRSGTTFLHEMLTLDERFTSPTTYQCFEANHFLVTEWLGTKLLWILLPSRRPMDDVRSGWHAPQEDEFALCSLGLPSPYHRMAFPNHPAPCSDYLDLEAIPPEELQAWQQGLLYFLKCLTFRCQKPIVLKSPTHTGRLKVLSQLFPNAKFVHIVRNPYATFASTMRLWKVLDESQGLQIPHNRQLEEYVFDSYERMYANFYSQHAKLGGGRIQDIRYEDLVRDPVTQLQKVYENLQLGDFELVRDKIQKYSERSRGHRTNQHELTGDVLDRITERWHLHFEKFGYLREDGRVSDSAVA